MNTKAASSVRVKVRMYRTGGLGDCFLLSFAKTGEQDCHILIDCGVFFGTPDAKNRMEQVALNIKQECHGKLDAVVATHEHWDHLSGFYFAKEIFGLIDIKEVWVAWTEDKQNPLSRRLREQRYKALTSLHAAANRLRTAGNPLAAEIEEVLSFHGPFSASGKAGTAVQMDLVQSWAKVRYCRPGEPAFEVPRFPEVRVYVLGPPEDELLIQRSNPRKGQVYGFGLESIDIPFEDEHSSFYAAATSDVEAVGSPFHRRFAIPMSEMGLVNPHSDFFKERYGYGTSEDHGPSWRRIDSDWLGITEHLSLALDSNTNNTSLVLAFEIMGEEVLLFPGDAQVGNWLSWGKLAWDEEGRWVTAGDLLKRTVLYKVGHHASHNATLSTDGLELMGHADLVALIPVDEGQAKRKKWAMPYQPLYNRLLDKTQGRILRADKGIPERPASINEKQWSAFLERVQDDPSEEKLWVDITM